jgi:hypothetical protein
MRPNPGEEWQRLTKLYGEMSEGELLELAAGYSDLTEFAQPILRDEMKKRGLDDPSRIQAAASKAKTTFGGWTRTANSGSDSDGDSGSDGESGSEEPPVEYTWKTPLCDCEDKEQAFQFCEALRRAGIESWTDRPGSTFGTTSVATNVIRILVAADQLEEARAVIEKPIPQEIIDQSREKPEDFVPPVCPKCGAADPTLESVDPIDSWICEDCGAQWTGNPAFGAATPDPAP